MRSGREKRGAGQDDEIFGEVKPGGASRIVPTLRKEREESGTHFLICGRQF
jgi:hypothetical protein